MRRAVVIAVGLGLAASGAAHELPDTSATVVIRDGGAVQLRLQVAYADAMPRIVAPGLRPDAYLAGAANAAVPDFERDLSLLHAVLQRETVVKGDGGAPIALRHWQFPRAEDVRAACRSAVMARLAQPAGHQHAERLTVTADGLAAGAVRSVQIRLPAGLGPALVTAYHPQERWLTAGEWSPVLAVLPTQPAAGGRR